MKKKAYKEWRIIMANLCKLIVNWYKKLHIIQHQTLKKTCACDVYD